MDTDKKLLDFHIRMEELYPFTGNKENYKIKRVFFRGNTSAKTLLDMYNSKDTLSATADPYQNGGCSESCEVYLTE